MAGLKPRYSQESIEDLEEPYYCSPTYEAAEIICPGSDMEETPEETKVKRQQYEDAAKQFVARKRPKLLSASLRGPLESGWANPWAYRPRHPRDGDWWQIGSNNIPLNQAHVVRRASQGLGYMRPKEALAWCEASAQEGLGSQFPYDSMRSLKSVERDHVEEMNTEGGELDAVGAGYKYAEQAHRLSMTNNYAITPYEGEGEEYSRRVKRPMEAEWLKGSYVSKRARWEGPTPPSPTPVALEVHRERRRAQIPAQVSASRILPPPLSGFGSIQRPRHVPSTQLQTQESTPSHTRHKQPFETRFNNASSVVPDRQIDDFNEHFEDELHDATFSSFSSQPSPSKTGTNPRLLQTHSVSDLETDELTTKSFDMRHSLKHITNAHPSSAQSSASSANKLPLLLRSAAISYEEEDSFVTEVAPSSRDLEMFMFRKKRKATQTQKMNLEPTLRNPTTSSNALQNSPPVNESIPNHSPIPYLGSQLKDTRHSHPHRLSANISRSQSSRLDLKQPTRETISSPFPQSVAMNSANKFRRADEDSQSAMKQVSTPGWKSFGDVNNFISFNSIAESSSHPQKFLSTALPANFAAKNSNIPQQIYSPSIRLSQRAQAEDNQPFKRSPENSYSAIESVKSPVYPTTQRSPDSTQNIMGGGVMNYIGPHSKRIIQNLGSLRVAEDIISSQDPKDFSTQSYNTTLACSQKTPLKPRMSTKGKPPLSRLQRFSFEAGFGNLLFSPLANPLPVPSNGYHSQKRKSVIAAEPDSHENPDDTSLGENKAYMGLDRILNKSDKEDDVVHHFNEHSIPGGTVVKDAIEPIAEGLQIGTKSKVTEQHVNPVNDNILHHGTARSGSDNTMVERSDTSGDQGATDGFPKIPSQIRLDPSPQASLQKPSSLENKGYFPQAQASEQVGPETEFQAKIPALANQQPPSHHKTSLKVVEDVHDQEFNESFLLCSGSRPVRGPRANGEIAPEQVEQAEIEEAEVEDSEITVSTQSSNGTDSSGNVNVQKPVPRQVTQVVQSPFAQESFVLNKPIIHSNSGDEASGDAESETSWEGCAPQSPWATETSNDLRARTLIPAAHTMPQDPLQDPDVLFSAVLADILPKRQARKAVDDETSIASSPMWEDQNFGITAFRDLMSASPSPVHKTTPSARVPTNTQQLFNAALQNPWTSSLKKPASKRPRKSVTFAYDPSKDSSEVNEPEIGESHASPPPDDDVLNEVMFGTELTQATPFSSHFKVARKFSRILPEILRSPIKSSPPLSGQAEAFIAADLSRPSIDRESPIRHLMPRSDTDENSHWRDWDAEKPKRDVVSPRPSQSKEGHILGMANFDMDEALTSMGDFLGDWSVEAEIKKTQESSSSRRQREDNGARRRRLLGLV